MTSYYFVGIKGSGMSSMAQILFDMGHTVSGSDREERYFTQKNLEEKGIPFFVFSADNVFDENTIYIIGNAFNEFNNEEVKVIKEKGWEHYDYPTFLSSLTQQFTSIAISGTHGKTSTTGLLAHALGHVDKTSYLIGDGTGQGVEDSKYFAFEACEYKRHFLSYRPDYAIVTNIEFDHPDYFVDQEDVLEAFRTFVSQAKKAVVLCGDDELMTQIETELPTIRYGVGEKNDVRADKITVTSSGMKFDLLYQGRFVETILINRHGMHHVLNTLAALSILLLEKVEIGHIVDAFNTFQGVQRRFTEQRMEESVIIDDYAHHPTEIRVTIESAKMKYPEKKLIAIFQPHTFSRTEALMEDFSNSFEQAEEVYLCDIFASVREKKGNVTIQDLIIKTKNAKLFTKQTLTDLKKEKNAVFLFMGAGNVNQYIDQLKKV